MELTGGRQIGLELAAEGSEELVVTMTTTAPDRPRRAPRPHSASEAELVAHAAFLESVKSPLWRS